MRIGDEEEGVWDIAPEGSSGIYVESPLPSCVRQHTVSSTQYPVRADPNLDLSVD